MMTTSILPILITTPLGAILANTCAPKLLKSQVEFEVHTPEEKDFENNEDKTIDH